MPPPGRCGRCCHLTVFSSDAIYIIIIIIITSSDDIQPSTLISDQSPSGLLQTSSSQEYDLVLTPYIWPYKHESKATITITYSHALNI